MPSPMLLKYIWQLFELKVFNCTSHLKVDFRQMDEWTSTRNMDKNHDWNSIIDIPTQNSGIFDSEEKCRDRVVVKPFVILMLSKNAIIVLAKVV